MSIDIFSTRQMMLALDQRKPAHTFLRSMFVREVVKSESEYVDMDVIKGKRRMAPFVHHMLEGKVVSREGYSTKTVKPAYIKQKMVTTAEDVLRRSPGENIYSAKSPEQRAAELLGKDMATLDEMITRREEWMVAQGVFTGQVAIVGEGVNYTVDFGYEADVHKLILGTGSKWGDSGVDPLADLREWRRDIIKRSGLTPNIALMGSGAVDAFLAALPEKALNYRKVELAQINPALLPQGVTYWGYVQDSGLDIYSYDEWYLDDNGVEQPMVPVNAVLLASTAARTVMHYGCIKDLAALYAVDRHAKSWVVEDPSARFLLMQSAPLFNPVQVDGFQVITVK